VTPRYRGGGDDWFDDKKDSGHLSSRDSRVKQRLRANASSILPSRANGTVIEVSKKFSRVCFDIDGLTRLCTYRRANVLGHSGFLERTPVAVGDRVYADILGSKDGVIEGVAERKNVLARLAPGCDHPVRHVLAANLDKLVIIVSVKEPEFTPEVLDRFLVLAGAQNVEPIICINKMDLHSSAYPRLWDPYIKWGYTVILASTTNQLGIKKLRNELLDRTSIFCGCSGVGKTSLLRELLEREIGKIGEISEALGKGKHTTRSSVLYTGWSPKTFLIDTPGISELNLIEIPQATLSMYFPGFSELECTKSGCLHQKEETCQARGLSNYKNYLNLYESLAPFWENSY